ncbi:MAG: hypothetical protein U9R08_03505 [Nanoarchaeota archaeon]|nr:hypothetical protein [Nanoarchaeota archaeon]
MIEEALRELIHIRCLLEAMYGESGNAKSSIEDIGKRVDEIVKHRKNYESDY